MERVVKMSMTRVNELQCTVYYITIGIIVRTSGTPPCLNSVNGL